MGSWLLVAITNHITQNVAAIPFLWLLPLSHLPADLRAVLRERPLVPARRWFLPPTAVLLLVCAYGLQDSGIGVNIKVAIPLYAVGLFFFCMFLHGELAQLRPGPRYLTRFYLMLSLGGALGGITVALIAPRVLPAYYELGLGFIITALLAMAAAAPESRSGPTRLGRRGRRPGGPVRLFPLCADRRTTWPAPAASTRNFYGNLLSLDVHREDPRDDVRQLYHGSIKHGEQYLTPERRLQPTTYYGPTSGIGRAIAGTRPARRWA